MHGEETKSEVPAKKGKGGIKFAAVTAILALVGGAITVFYISQRTRHVSTGNARVTADLITLRSTSPGFLERFTLYEGRSVREGEILGWIENGESFRSPVNGIVVDTNVTVGQHILPMEALATIADMSNMSGNVWEWVWDWWSAYPSVDETDPVGTVSGFHRVFRGGGWGDPPEHARSAIRNSFNPDVRIPDIGFRVVRP